MLQHSIGIMLLKELVCSQVKGRDDLLRVANELGVEVLIEASQVVAIYIQEWLFQCVDLQRHKKGTSKKPIDTPNLFLGYIVFVSCS